MLSACTAGSDPDAASDTDADTTNPTMEAETDVESSTNTPETDAGSDTEDENETDATGETDDTSMDTSGSSGEAELTFEAYLDGYNAAICSQSIACGTIPGPEHCNAVELGFEETRTAFDNGELAFDGLAAANCIAVRMAQEPSCSSLFAEPTPQEEMARQAVEEACAPVLTGLVAIGDACNAIEACAGGPSEAYCADLSSAQCMPGVCTAAAIPGDVGGECDAFDQSGTNCHEGLYCRPANLEGGSSVGTCEEPEDPGAECFGDDWCSPGSFCASGAGPGTCQAIAATGDPCVPNDHLQRPCASTLDYCDAVTEVCTPRIELGSPCGEGSLCVRYGTCAEGTCVARAGLNESCDSANPEACMGFSYCDPEQSICTHFEYPACE